MSTERVIVQRQAVSSLLQELTALFKQAAAGDIEGDHPAVLGALFTQGSAENVIAMMKEAVAAGAKVALGDLTRQGAVVQPHIVTDVRPGMRLWDRESFGPGTYLPCTRRRSG